MDACVHLRHAWVTERQIGIRVVAVNYSPAEYSRDGADLHIYVVNWFVGFLRRRALTQNVNCHGFIPQVAKRLYDTAFLKLKLSARKCGVCSRVLLPPAPSFLHLVNKKPSAVVPPPHLPPILPVTLCNCFDICVRPLSSFVQ